MYFRYGQVEFESTEIAEEILKENKEFELDGETVKTSKHPPWGRKIIITDSHACIGLWMQTY